MLKASAKSWYAVPIRHGSMRTFPRTLNITDILFKLETRLSPTSETYPANPNLRYTDQRKFINTQTGRKKLNPWSRILFRKCTVASSEIF
jgi:hypothetical protein